MNHRAKRISRRATGTKKSGAKKIYPRVMEMTRGTALGRGGERIYREEERREKFLFPPQPGFLLPA